MFWQRWVSWISKEQEAAPEREAAEMAPPRVLQRVESYAGSGIVALVVFGCAVVLMPFVSAILWASILCFSTWPLYRALRQGLHGRRNLAAALMTVSISLIMVVPLAVVSLSFADNISRLVARADALLAQGLPPPPEWLSRVPVVGGHLSAYLTELFGDSDRTALIVKSWMSRTGAWLLRNSLAIGQGIAQLTLSMLVAFFLYRDGESLVSRIGDAGRRILGDYSQYLLGIVGNTVKGVVYGVIGTALGQGIMAGIGFTIAGVPSPLLFGLLTFFLSPVPIGPPMVWVPATIWLFQGDQPGWGVFMLIWGLIGISGIDNILRPIIISRGAELPFVLVLLGALGGIPAFGFIGIFLGPTLLAVGFCLLKEVARRRPAALAADASPDS